MVGITQGASTVRALASGTLLVLVSACGSFAGTDDPGAGIDTTTRIPSPNASSANSAANAPPASSTSNTPPPDPNSPACVAQAATLQTLFDKDNVANGSDLGSNGVLAVQTPTCGKQIILANANVSASSDSADGYAPPPAISATSLHRIGDITKTFVSVVVLSLVEAGKIGLDDTLQHWGAQPGVALEVPNADQITVRMLLNQTSGLADYMGSDEIAGDRLTPRAPQQLVGYAIQMGSVNTPGAKFNYSATNYVILGLIAQSASAASITELLHTYAFGPANLTATFFAGGEPITGSLAEGVDDDGNNLSYVQDPSVAWAAGAIVSSPSDMLDWVTGLYSGTTVSASLLSTLLATPVSVGGKSGTTYGLGVFEYPALNATMPIGQSLGHDGWVMGYSSKAAYFPDSKTTIVVMLDSNDANVAPIINDVASALP